MLWNIEAQVSSKPTRGQPEHGVPDHMSADQAKLARDSRAMPEFVLIRRLVKLLKGII